MQALLWLGMPAHAAWVHCTWAQRSGCWAGAASNAASAPPACLAGNTLPTRETASPEPGCNVADWAGQVPCPATADYLCACVAPGGEAWVPWPEVRTRCAKLAEFIQFEIIGEQEGTKICRARPPATAGSGWAVAATQPANGSIYYGELDSATLVDCKYSMPDGPNPCGSRYEFGETYIDVLCEQLV